MSEINAVTPTGTTTLIHLHKIGYVPPTGTSKTPKHRSSVNQRTMCALFVRTDAAVVPLADALGWPGRRLGPGLPQWRWCGLCVGRALAATDQIGAAVRLLAEEEDGLDPNAPPIGAVLHALGDVIVPDVPTGRTRCPLCNTLPIGHEGECEP